MFHCDENSEEYERFRPIWEILNSETPSDSDLDEARKALGEMKEKDAEWHYVSAAVCFRTRWYLECKRHLKKAMKLSPQTGKYKEAYDGLTAMADEAAKGNSQLPSREFDGCAETCLEGCCASCC